MKKDSTTAMKAKKGMRHRMLTMTALVFSGFMILPGAGNAQKDQKSEEITVVAPYTPSLSDAEKLNFFPEIKDQDTSKPLISYTLLSKIYNAPLILDPLVAAKIKGEPIAKLYKNYIRAGMGNYTTPYFEFFANSLRSKEYLFGVHAGHLSSSGKIKDFANCTNSNNMLEVYGKRFFGEHTLRADAGFNRRGLHFYGFRPGDYPAVSLSKDDIRQRFILLTAGIGLNSTYTDDERVNHELSASYYFLKDDYEASEHNIKFKASADKDVSLLSFTEKENIGGSLLVDYFANKDSLSQRNNAVIEFRPLYSLSFDEYFVEAGINVAIEADTVAEVRFHPLLRAEVKVIEDRLITYAGIRGSLTKNSFRLLSEANPFISSTLTLPYSNNKFEQFGGVKGNLFDKMDYDLGFSNASYDNLPFFVSDTSCHFGGGIENQFSVVYDDVRVTSVHASLGYRLREKLQITFAGDFHSYFTKEEKEAWHRPGLELRLMAAYNIQDKILVSGEVFTMNKRYARTFGADKRVVPVELKGFADLNIGIEYRHTRILSAFLNLNNLANTRNYRWYNYPGYRFNVMAGIAYSF
jgi:hypothetical protein